MWANCSAKASVNNMGRSQCCYMHRCTVASCNEPRISVTHIYCAKHICKGNCTGLGCNTRDNGINYCQEHTRGDGISYKPGNFYF